MAKSQNARNSQRKLLKNHIFFRLAVHACVRKKCGKLSEIFFVYNPPWGVVLAGLVPCLTLLWKNRRVDSVSVICLAYENHYALTTLHRSSGAYKARQRDSRWNCQSGVQKMAYVPLSRVGFIRGCRTSDGGNNP